MSFNLKQKSECLGDKATCTLEECLYGTLRKDGRVKGCMDKTGQGAANFRKGHKAQDKAIKQLGVKVVSRKAATNESTWSSAFRNEVKEGAQVNPIGTIFGALERFDGQTKAVGDARGFRLTVYPANMGGRGIVMVDTDVWESQILPYLPQEAR